MKRNKQLQDLNSTAKFEIIVIGGGAIGLCGAVDAASRSPEETGGGRSANDPAHWVEYGSDLTGIRRLLNQNARLAQTLRPNHPYQLAEVQSCIEREMACIVENGLARRIGLLFLDARAAVAAASRAAEMLAKYLKHDLSWMANQVAAFNKLAGGYLQPSNRPAPGSEAN